MLLALNFDVGLNASHAHAVNEWRVYATSKYPEEACGLVLHGGLFKPIENIALNKLRYFEMAEASYAQEYLDKKIAGVLHSHPHEERGDNKPGEATHAASSYDMQHQIALGLPFGISVTSRDSCSQPVWFGDSLPIRPLVGRVFLHGISDCCSLVRDWHRLQGIPVPDFPRDDKWWDNGKDMYAENFGKAGFVKVDRQQPIEGDVFLARVRAKVLNHAGVYVGKGQVLHHVYGSLSRHSPATLWLKEMAVLIRHKDLPEGV